ncbi:MAG: hypothetical protein NXI31_06580 [bacterium]|nr:hypothetical protein [bacterium]
MDWQQIGSVSKAALSSARLQLHFGAYVLGSTAHAVSPHRADDSHTNLGFVPELGALRTRDLGDGFELHLDVVRFALVLRAGDDVAGALALDGQTLDDALAWVGERLAARSGSSDAVTITRREYPDFPASPILAGGSFEQPGRAELEELRTWFGCAAALLEELQASATRMTDVRVWPHHFDLGALIPISDSGDVTIGLGFSPGDDHFDQPYFYCSPYPAPQGGDLPALAAGSWQTDTFTSAILTAAELEGSAGRQELARTYVTDAVARCRELLGGASS